ncbi:MAG: TatD family hydrolase [Fastidiosipila sp.]|nr:TatD family hydrolase [Fastidiosipila sp.]
MWFDSHSHLQDKAFSKDREEVLEQAASACVNRILLATSDLNDSKKAYNLALTQDQRKSPRLYTSLGFHPHEASNWDEDSETVIADMISADRLRQKAGNQAIIVAIGEIGLDYHYLHSPAEIQREVFYLQIEIAAKYNLPIIVHMREATDDTLKILRNARSRGLLQRTWGDSEIGVMHCYSENTKHLPEFIDLGFMIGFDGPITFKNGTEARAALAATPIDRLLLETDAPYLTPVPYRGKRNESSYLTYIGEKAAEIKGLTPAEIAKQTTDNALRLFRLKAKD